MKDKDSPRYYCVALRLILMGANSIVPLCRATALGNIETGPKAAHDPVWLLNE